MPEIVEITCSIKANVSDVYEAIKDKDKLQSYFVSSASMSLQADETISWEWADYNARCDIKVIQLIPNEVIKFIWPAEGDSKTVCMTLKQITESSTEIRITESEFGNTPAEITKIKQQTQGWTDFVCSLKAYLYTGINLRNGTQSK